MKIETWGDMAGLMEQVAAHLTGRPFEVRLQGPTYRGAVGMMYPTPSGGAVIDLDPDRPLDETLDTFLHEVAHARLHYVPVSVEIHHDIPHSLDWSGEESAEDRAKEAEAEALAARWKWYGAKLGAIQRVAPGAPNAVVRCLCGLLILTVDPPRGRLGGVRSCAPPGGLVSIGGLTMRLPTLKDWLERKRRERRALVQRVEGELAQRQTDLGGGGLFQQEFIDSDAEGERLTRLLNERLNRPY